MAITYSQVVCLESHAVPAYSDYTATPPIVSPAFDYQSNQTYEMDSRMASKFLAGGWMIPYDSTFFTNPKRPSFIWTNVIHVGQ